jgi:hypothetical protein
MIFLRSLVEFVFALMAYTPEFTRQNLRLPRDIAYGLLTCLYLVLMCAMARAAASPYESGSDNARHICSNIRKHILQRLESQTNSARIESPPFDAILQELEENLDGALATGGLATGSSGSEPVNRKAALRYISLLRDEFGNLDPKKGNEYQSRARTVSSLFSRKPAGSARQSRASSTYASNPNLRHTLKKSQPSGNSLRPSDSRDFATPTPTTNTTPRNSIAEPQPESPDNDTASRHTSRTGYTGFTNFTSPPVSRPGAPRNFSAPAGIPPTRTPYFQSPVAEMDNNRGPFGQTYGGVMPENNDSAFGTYSLPSTNPSRPPPSQMFQPPQTTHVVRQSPSDSEISGHPVTSDRLRPIASDSNIPVTQPFLPIPGTWPDANANANQQYHIPSMAPVPPSGGRSFSARAGVSMPPRIDEEVPLEQLPPTQRPQGIPPPLPFSPPRQQSSPQAQMRFQMGSQTSFHTGYPSGHQDTTGS